METESTLLCTDTLASGEIAEYKLYNGIMLVEEIGEEHCHCMVPPELGDTLERAKGAVTPCELRKLIVYYSS